MTARTFEETIARLRLPDGGALGEDIIGSALTVSADIGATIGPRTWAASEAVAETALAPGRAEASPADGRRPVLPILSIRLPGATATGAPARPSEDFVVRSVLAEGGMGRLFVAEQRSLEREVVVKTIRDRSSDVQARSLLAEGIITGSLEHPNITPVHLAGTDADGSPLLVMKRIAGVSWSALLESDEAAWARVAMTSRERGRAHLEILMQVASAVHFAHESGVVHRDIKPDNVMVGELGEVYVVDWGVAIRQQPEGAPPDELCGTPCFLAPEMLGEGVVGPWTDVYLLGATLHLVLTGRPRHEGASVLDALKSAWTSAAYPYSAEVPDELAALANASTARDPEMRPASALAFRQAIADHLEHADSMGLAADGWARVEQLAALRERGTVDPLRQARLVTEAQFAFRSALGSWPDNPRALAGLKASLIEALELELVRENLEAARAVAAELEPVPDEQATRIEELAAKVEQRSADAQRLAKIDHDRDFGVGASGRRWLFVALLLICVGVTLAFFTRLPSLQVTSESGGTVFAVGVLAFVPILLLLWVLRKHLLQNRLNRELAGMLVLGLTLLVVQRGLEWQAGADAIATLRNGLVLLSAPCFAIAVFVRRAAAWAGVVMLGGGGLAAWFPEQTVPVFGLANVIAALLLVWSLRGGARPLNGDGGRA